MAQTTYKAVVFDLDGTLINSLQDLADSTNFALQKLGYPTHQTESYRYFVGKGVAKLIEAVLPEEARNEEIEGRMRSLFDEYYDAHYLDHTLPYPSIPELIEVLKEKKFRLAVVSNKPHAFVRKMVRELFSDSFDIVFGQREGVPRKPDPAGPLEACANMGVKPEECLYLGDSGVDMLTANAAKMTAIGVTWGFRTEEELKDNGAAYIISKPDELMRLLII